MNKMIKNILVSILGVGLTVLGFITWEGIFLLPGVGILIYHLFVVVKYFLNKRKENKESKEDNNNENVECSY